MSWPHRKEPFYYQVHAVFALRGEQMEVLYHLPDRMHSRVKRVRDGARFTMHVETGELSPYARKQKKPGRPAIEDEEEQYIPVLRRDIDNGLREDHRLAQAHRLIKREGMEQTITADNWFAYGLKLEAMQTLIEYLRLAHDRSPFKRGQRA